MKPFLRLASVLMVATSALLVAACDNKAPEQTETETAPAEGASAAAAGPFDVNSVALSTASLGDFPYLRLPRATSRRTARRTTSPTSPSGPAPGSK